MCWETQFCLFICLFCLQSSKVKCWLMGLLCSGSLLSTWSFIGTVKRHLLILATHLNVAVRSRVSWPRLSSWSQYQWQDGNTRLLNHWNWMCNPSLIFVRKIYDLFPYITQNAQRVDYQNQDIFIQVYLCPGYTPHVTHSPSSSLPSTQSRGTLSVKWSPSGVDHVLLCATTMAHTEFYHRVCISLSYWQRWWRVSYISISPTLGEGCDPSSVSYTHLLSVPGENHTGRPNRAVIFSLLPISP